MKILNLTINKSAFDVMVTGEKQIEYRRKSKWIESRLRDKNGIQKLYDYVKFTNGYGKDRPYFIAKYESYGSCWNSCGLQIYSNGLRVFVNSTDYYILLGEIIERKL